MSNVFTDDFATLAVGANVTGRVIPGTSLTWTNASGGAHGLVGATGGGLIPSSPTTTSQLGAVYFTGGPLGELIWTIDPTTGPTDGLVITLTPSVAEKSTNAIVVGILPNGDITLSRTGGASPGEFRRLSGQTMPTTTHKIAIYFDLPTATLRVRRLSAADAVLSEVTEVLNAARVLTPTIWFSGYNFANAPVETVFRKASMDDLASGAAAPIYATPESVKTGRYTANITFTSNVAGGEAFYLTKTTNVAPTKAEMLASKFATGVLTGANTIPVTGLVAGWLYYAFVMPRGPGKDVGLVSAAGSFMTDAALSPPGGSTAVSFAGDTVTVTYTPSGTVSSATASLPVGGTPNGAVAQGPVAMTFGGGVWTAVFTLVPAGSYAAPVVLASNADNPSVSITGATAFTIIPIDGSDEPDGSEFPDVPVAFSGTVSAQAATVGVPFTLNLASYFTGTRVPFVGSLFAGSLAGSGLALSGFVISGTPTSAATLAGLVVRATDADGATADTNAFSITIAAAADVTKPVMTGSISITAKTHNSYTSSVAAATDNVGVTGYRVSQDGGSNWIDKATARTHDHTGRTPGATDQVRWSARDTAGNWADPLSLAVTLDAAPVTPVLSTPTGSATSSTTATGGVTTNKVGGTLYTLDAVGSPNATAIKAGSSRTVTTAGLQTVTTSGLTPDTTGYQRHYIWTDADGVDSAIVRSTAFNTPAGTTLPPGPGGRLSVSQSTYFDLLARGVNA